MAFVEDNIERIIKQCESGDEAMSFLAIYSFIEGYFRAEYPKEFKWENNWKFYSIVDKIKNRYLATPFPAEEKLYDEMKKYHGETELNAYKNLKTFTDTNRIRHCFENIRPGTLSVVISQFSDFAKYRGFSEDVKNKISDLTRTKAVENSWRSIPPNPDEESILNNQPDGLLLEYESICKNRESVANIISKIEKIEEELVSESTKADLNTLVQQLKEKRKDFENAKKKYDEFSEYENYLNELSLTLVEARSKKKYESQIIYLSEKQKEIVIKDIDGLTDKPGHSMYIKGGPGTGKTLLLIAILFKLYSSKKRTKLLTYYPTLNKYISYLFDLYNDNNLLKDLSISPLNEKQLNTLNRSGILSFEDYILPKISDALEIQRSSVKKLEKIKDKLIKLISKVETDERKCIRLYDKLTGNVWPNLLTEPSYYTDKVTHEIQPQKKEEWEKIKTIIDLVEEKQLYSDVYVYYKFSLDKNIDKIALSNSLEDYILIDEAQDLTNAQIYAINKFVDEKGGLILAGDPSQEIRNKRITMGQLDVNIGGGKRYNPELIQNFRSSKLIQDLGNSYKLEPCLHIRKNTKSVDGITAGPPPEVFITDDTENSNYEQTINQITTSVKMCINDLFIPQENICIVAFTENDLLTIQSQLDKKGFESVLIYKDFSFRESKKNQKQKIKLCTVNEIKGIDCSVLMFFISDQSKEENYGGIVPELKANAIYTCITRAMYLLQVFIPRYCVFKDLSVAALINLLKPNDKEISDYIEEQNKKERKGIPIRKYFESLQSKTRETIIAIIENDIKSAYVKKYGTDENCFIDYTEDETIAFVYARKKVVSEVQDELTEISIADAIEHRAEAKVDDEIEVYISPDELEIESEVFKNLTNGETDAKGNVSEPERILNDVYKKLADKRTDEYGNSKPNTEKGYLNIAGCGLKKPIDFGYEKWPDYIRDNTDKFDFVKIPYKFGGGFVFAFRPHRDNVKINRYLGTIKRTFPSYAIIQADINNQIGDYYFSFNNLKLPQDWNYSNIKKGLKVQFSVSKYFDPQGKTSTEKNGVAFDVVIVE